MTEPSSRVAVVGVGNPAMGDDGVGERIVEALRDRGLPPDVELTHAGTTAFFALEAMDGADRAVIIDAIATGDAEPGAVHRYRYHEGEWEAPDLTMHDFTFADALRAGRTAYDVPEEMIVVGVEPASTSVGIGLSDPVADSVPAAVEAVIAEVPGATAADSQNPRTTTSESPNPRS